MLLNCNVVKEERRIRERITLFCVYKICYALLIFIRGYERAKYHKNKTNEKKNNKKKKKEIIVYKGNHLQ